MKNMKVANWSKVGRIIQNSLKNIWRLIKFAFKIYGEFAKIGQIF